MADLRALADTQLEDAEGLGEVARFAWDWGTESQDARYIIVGDVIVEIDSWWLLHDGRGGVPRQALDAVAAILRQNLLGVLDAEERVEGIERARDLQQEVRAKLTGPDAWIERGWAQRGGPTE